MRKFFKTTYVVTVLSEDHAPSDIMDLRDILTECESGGWSGSITDRQAMELSSLEMAKELINQNSSPTFFDLDDDGTDLIDMG